MEIIDRLARSQKVEEVIRNLTHRRILTEDYKDLCQNIYVRLLDYPEYIIKDLWEHSAQSLSGKVTQMDCFLVRIAKNQLSPTGPFGWMMQQRKKIVPLLPIDTEDDEW